MATKKRGLGRGLNALLGSGVSQQAEQSKPTPPGDQDKDSGKGVNENNTLKHLPVEFIQPGKYQPRLDIRAESLEDLANSIRAQGIMQPIVVRAISTNKYEIVAGERRWRACQLAGLDTIPVIIKQVADEAAVAMALIENIQRENLNPIEEAMALQRLIDEFDLTQQEVADAVGKSRTTVTNLLRLMSLNTEVRHFVERGELEMGHARALLSLPLEKQLEAGKTIKAKGLSVRQTEALVRRMLSQKQSKGSTEEIDPDIRHLQDNLSEKLGTRVSIQHTAKGKGKLVLAYNSIAQLEGILDHIK